MPDFMRKSFNQPDEARELPLVKMDIVNIGNWNAYRFTFEPGWRWTEHTAPYAETETCMVEHSLWMIISGRFIVQMDDGRKEEFGPGDVGFLPPGHDAWVVGEEPVVGIDLRPINPHDS